MTDCGGLDGDAGRLFRRSAGAGAQTDRGAPTAMTLWPLERRKKRTSGHRYKFPRPSKEERP
jgi:hypothetical protein